MTKREIAQGILTGLLVTVALIVGANSASDLMAARKRAVDSPQNQVRQLWGQDVPTFEATNLTGERLRLPDPEEATVVYFFDTRCGAYAVNREQWDRLAQSMTARAKVIALSFEPAEALLRYVRSDSEASTTVVPDVSQFPDIRKHLRMLATPTLYVFAPSGKLKYSYVGVFNARTAGDAMRALDSR